MKPFLALALALTCLAARAEPVFILAPEDLHRPFSPADVAFVQQDGDALAKAARLAGLRPSGDFELRIWTHSVWTSMHGEGTAYVLAKGRLTTYALKRPHDHLRAVRVSSRRVAPDKLPVAELRAAWKVAGRPGCDVSDADIVAVEASLDGAPVMFSGPDTDDLCHQDVNVRLVALLQAVRALAGR